MMCKVFSILIFLTLVISGQLEDQTKEFNFISGVISALDNDEIMHHWRRNGTLKYENAVDILKDIVNEVKDIISVIDEPDYEDLKNFIVDTEISFWETFSFSFFKTCIITKSIGNILKLKDIYEKQGFESCQFKVNETYSFKDLDEIDFDFEAASQVSGVNELFTKIVLIEYEYIYLDIMQEICCIIRPYLYRYNFQFHENLFSNTKPLFNENYWKLANYFIKTSRNIGKDILIVGRTGRTFIMASKKGITFSRKCFWDMSGTHLDGEYETLLPIKKIQDFEHEFSKYNGMVENVLKKYINRCFVCNKATAPLLVSLIHFYTVRSSVDTEYEIFLNDKGLYEIKWSFSKLPSVESIKNYYWKKDVPASFYPLKKVKNVAFLKDFFVGHSIIKNNNENAKPIRLMVFSCGHQLGFELLDKFFNYDYGYIFRKTKCPICSLEIEIIGSHDVTVYIKKKKGKFVPFKFK